MIGHMNKSNEQESGIVTGHMNTSGRVVLVVSGVGLRAEGGERGVRVKGPGDVQGYLAHRETPNPLRLP